MHGAGVKALADHHAALGPAIRAFAHIDHASDHRAIANEFHVVVLECIGVVPDVVAVASDLIDAFGHHRAARIGATDSGVGELLPDSAADEHYTHD